jgi:hypothetical protein
MSRLRQRFPSPTFVVSLVALIVALGGTSYAAFAPPKNSVGTRQLKNMAVTPAKVAPKTIALFKGKKGATGSQGQRGPQGVQGIQGPPGVHGIQGQPGPGATTFTIALPRGTTTLSTLAPVGNGVTIAGACGNAGQPTVALSVAGVSDVVNFVGEFSRLVGDNDLVKLTDTFTNPFSLSDNNVVLFSGLVRDVSGAGTDSKFARIDVTGATGNSCSFQGMIIPSG